MAKLTKPEQIEFAALEAKRLDIYVGFNVIRHFFTEKPDAERFMELSIKRGADQPVFYGAQCNFGVKESQWKGPCWEFAEG